LAKPVRKFWRNCMPLQPTRAARLLLDGRKIEPYTIIIMGATRAFRTSESESADFSEVRGLGLRKHFGLGLGLSVFVCLCIYTVNKTEICLFSPYPRVI
jgi:hypothetical protein